MKRQSVLHSLVVLFVLPLVQLCACSSSEIEDTIELVDGVPRKSIDASTLGVNAFVNDNRFGSISSQFLEVQNTLRLRHVRVLFDWNDAVQGGPNAKVNYSFYDDIISSLPPGLDALVILTGVPGWMQNPANWDGGNPRLTFVNRWVRPTVRRYANSPRIVAWEIWNEPNMFSNPDNTALDIATNPANYVEILAASHDAIKNIDGGARVVSAATTAINQNFPGTLNYNREMRNAGATSFCDVWGVHYYGKQYEKLIQDDGVADFLNGLDKPVWVTESGAQGVNAQLAYGEEVWPFLRDEVPAIERIYQYQFSEATPSGSTYGMRNLDASFPVSDLYVHLRDRS